MVIAPSQIAVLPGYNVILARGSITVLCPNALFNQCEKDATFSCAAFHVCVEVVVTYFETSVKTGIVNRL